MGLLRNLFKSIFGPDAETVGMWAEKSIASQLRSLHTGKVLTNLYVPKYYGGTTEIDLVYITKVGTFVIESKNYNGYIFGRDTDQNWTETFNTKTFWGFRHTDKHHFFNPIIQNASHIKQLRHYIKTNIPPTFSIIVFSDGATLKKVDIYESDAIVCQQYELKSVIRDEIRNHPEIMSDEQVQSLYDKLLPLTVVSRDVKTKHVEDIVAKRHSNFDVCPYCKGKLVVRTSKKGRNVGRQFYGCSNYPKCKYTREIN